jgi:tripartite-type tricarboxylate transporter receptor subunit TctC
MPAAKVALIGRAVEQAMRAPELQAKFRAASMIPVAKSSAQTAKDLEAFRAKWEPVIRASGFKE